jgi:hypothetical protein
METQQDVQELKAERVQEELAAAAIEMPFQISLKAERVQDPALAMAWDGGVVSTSYEMSLNLRSVKFELYGPKLIITVLETGAA